MRVHLFAQTFAKQLLHIGNGKLQAKNSCQYRLLKRWFYRTSSATIKIMIGFVNERYQRQEMMTFT